MGSWYFEWCCLIPTMGLLVGLAFWAFLVGVKALYALIVNTWESSSGD